jgi:glutamate dehydrogenase/leucine dehydrogenase
MDCHQLITWWCCWWWNAHEKRLDMNEVLSLAKTMEVKFSVSDLQIGGAKSGINFDQMTQEKKGSTTLV